MLNSHIDYFDHLTAISQSVYQEYIKLKVPPKITLILNFIKQSRFEVDSFDRDKTFKKFRLPKDKKIILTVGRNHPKKAIV